ncbi:hypothetical protein M2347_002213 [Chryseobacterium sp. H1D6B]|uniref:TraQ conjugal transfer family protein n=1 Tax=Chryseobacterium sp. H1D6B TaxID=2940588 RepID=UPI0015C8E8E5|nr:TraQ conjugal transfer family protein [Chryseobacterium sp. H1D6B]MDH6252486.1 hypothetical protein [Chryseobacterium sp. H1D6B]
MKNLIKKNIALMFRYSLLLYLLAFILNSCQDTEIEIQQDFPFEVKVMPVPAKIGEGKTVEIRISLLTDSDFNGTTYSIRYFQYEGAGQLQYYSDPSYLPNDEYPLLQKEFRLYYTSTSSESHEFSIWIKDSFGNEKQIDFKFDNAS